MENQRKDNLPLLPKYVRNKIYKLAKKQYIIDTIEGDKYNLGMCYFIMQAINRLLYDDDSTPDNIKQILDKYRISLLGDNYDALLFLPEFNKLMRGVNTNGYIFARTDTKPRILAFDKIIKQTENGKSKNR